MQALEHQDDLGRVELRHGDAEPAADIGEQHVEEVGDLVVSDHVHQKWMVPLCHNCDNML